MFLTLDVHRAYARIEPKHAERARRLEESLDTLLALGRLRKRAPSRNQTRHRSFT